jgi:hypothetical protein
MRRTSRTRRSSGLKLYRARVAFSALLLALPAACTGGINAGEKGGQAFIAFTGMLLLTLGILWIVLSRER